MSRELLTRDQALTEAVDLDEVCRLRILSTAEIFEPNAYYGNDVVLKRYAGLALDRPLKVVVPHGIVLNPDSVWNQERLALLPAIFAYGERRFAALSTKTRKVVFRGTVPFAYVARMLDNRESDRRKGTLFFPSHSTQWIHAKGNYEALADHLLRMPDHLQPITVCIYWQDFLLGHHRPFAERGIPLVSAGHIHDPHFLFRLFYLLVSRKYASGNAFGSHTFYAIQAGCRYFHMGGFSVTYDPMRLNAEKDMAPPSTMEAHRLAEIFREPSEALMAAQLEAARSYTGDAYLETPENLRKRLLLAERLDWLGFGWDGPASKHCITEPPAYGRLARKAIRWTKQLVPVTRNQ